MKSHPWNEIEIKDAIVGYFSLLDAQQKGKSLNKAKIYRALSEKHPSRSTKAFERKFANISAILYEEKLPFVDGLLPFGNYQRLLKLLVLDYLDRNKSPYYIPQEILQQKIKSLYRKGILKANCNGSGRYGLAIERYLGIPQNSSKSADFMGIELKTSTGEGLQTLFSRIPSRYIDCANKKEFVLKHGYLDTKRKRQALYTSFSNVEDSLGFSLTVEKEEVFIIRNKRKVMSYNIERLEEALLSKLSETAFIKINTRKDRGVVFFEIERMVYGKWPSIIKFLKLINQGKVFLDFTLSIKESKVKDHGFLWKIMPDAFDDLFLKTEVIELKDNIND